MDSKHKTRQKQTASMNNRPGRASYRTSPIKRVRRTKSELSSIRCALYDILKVGQPMSVRQVFYQAVSRGIIDKTETEYKKTICRLLGIMRREKDVPFYWLSDSTRWMRKPSSFSSLENALQNTAQYYRRDLWGNQKSYIEIWLEKDALAGIVFDVTAEWDVPLMVTRGYPSLSFLYSAAESISVEQRPCFLYYFGDHDPSGVDIPRRIEKDLRDFAPDAEIHFKRMAVLPEQIKKYKLPTRPTKKTDTRFKNFKGESVEVDAIPPDKLRKIVRNCIEQHIDQDQLHRMQIVEQAERATLQTIIDNMEEGSDDDELE